MAGGSTRDGSGKPPDSSLLLSDAEEPAVGAAVAADAPVKPQAPAAKQKKKRKAAWVDPDNEKTRVDIQHTPRLRKLKASASEAVMQGAR